MISGDAAGFFEACKAGDDGKVRAMLDADPAIASVRAPTGETPLIAALYRGHQSIVDRLVAAGAPLDLWTAAALGRADIVEARLQEDPTSVHRQSYDGWTPLHLAAFFGHAGVVALLLERGADLQAVSGNGMRNTALHAAVAGGRVDAALTLIDAGAPVNAVDGGGHTPLHIAAEGGYVPIVESLLRHDADAHAVDAEDRTPLARAAARNHAAVIDLFTLSE